MNLVALDIPDDRAARIAWLERLLVSDQLRDFCIFSATARVLPDSSQDLRFDFAELWADIQREGLGVLNDDQLSQLLRQPLELLSLQDKIWTEYPEYWAALLPSHDPGATETFPDDHDAPVNLKPQQNRESSLLSWSLVITSLAALILLAFSVRSFFPDPANSTASKWGWNSPLSSATELSEKQYLTLLADQGMEWFKQEGNTAEDYKIRLEQMIDGCEQLISANHPALSTEKEAELRQKCQNWLIKFKEQLAKVEQDPSRFQSLRQETDEVVRKLDKALRTMAGADAFG